MNTGSGNLLNLLIEYLPRVIVLLVCLPIHEMSHAFVANAYGDDTPRLNGRLTLNPFAHLDVLGSFLILFQGFGWAKPVPINPSVLRQRSPSAVMWVSAAGPLSNLVLAFLAFFPLRFVYGLFKADLTNNVVLYILVAVLFGFLEINLLLAIFNLIPLAPLDGEKVLEFFLPAQVIPFFDRVRPYAPIVLIAVFFILPYFGVHLFSFIMAPIDKLLLILIGAK
jgi:Zn-dependent protease